MNSVDLALAFLLAVCALRGYGRGFLRESFGLIALVGGIAAAFRWAAEWATVMQQYLALPTAVQTGMAFVVIFVVVHTVLNGIGVLLDRLAGALQLGGINRVVGAALGVGKGAAVLAFVLLFLHLFPLIPALDGHIMSSTIGPPLVSVAGIVIRTGMQTTPQPDLPNKT